jgi:hypothetical protein
MNGDNAIAIHNNQILAKRTTTKDNKGSTKSAEKQRFTNVITNFCHNHLSQV